MRNLKGSSEIMPQVTQLNLTSRKLQIICDELFLTVSQVNKEEPVRNSTPPQSIPNYSSSESQRQKFSPGKFSFTTKKIRDPYRVDPSGEFLFLTRFGFLRS